MNVFDFKVKDAEGKEVSLTDYLGKVMLIVNTATGCGLTPQYEALEALYEKYKDKGFVILDFPCNQFLEQAPGTIDEINEFCTLNYGTTFPRFAKIAVNGDEADPLFKWLKSQAPVPRDDAEAQEFYEKVAEYTPGIEDGDIRWNFNKFLIGLDGEVIDRYSPTYDPKKLDTAVKTALRP